MVLELFSPTEPYEFVWNMNNGIDCTLSRFAYDIKLSGVLDTRKGSDTIQKEPDRWTCVTLMKFSKAKHEVLHMGQSKHKYGLGNEWFESSPVDKDLHVLKDEILSMRQQLSKQLSKLAAQKASNILCCIRRVMACRLREVILSP